MTQFNFYTVDNAPLDSKSVLENVQNQLGCVPNLLAGLAEAPSSLKAYLQLTDLLQHSSLSPVEVHIAALAASVENRCNYCVPFHSHVARSELGIDDAIVDAAREGREIPEPRLNALANFTQAVVQNRGWVSDQNIDAFLAAGFERSNVLDVVLAITLKTLSNYSNRIMNTPLDEAFATESGYLA